MTVDRFDVSEFVEKERLKLELFAQFWEKKRRSRPDEFPSNLSDGDWFEHYACWHDDMVGER